MTVNWREPRVRRVTEVAARIPIEVAIYIGEVEETVSSPIAIIKRPIIAVVVDVLITHICAHDVIVPVAIIIGTAAEQRDGCDSHQQPSFQHRISPLLISPSNNAAICDSIRCGAGSGISRYGEVQRWNFQARRTFIFCGGIYRSTEREMGP